LHARRLALHAVFHALFEQDVARNNPLNEDATLLSRYAEVMRNL
jgi:hypothetical protein